MTEHAANGLATSGKGLPNDPNNVPENGNGCGRIENVTSSPNPVADNPAGDQPRVKALDLMGGVASTIFGTYRIIRRADGLFDAEVPGGDRLSGTFADEAGVVTALQSDYERRVLACLEDACVSPNAKSETQSALPLNLPPDISRDLLGEIVDEVFDGAIEDASVIEDIYRVIARACLEPGQGEPWGYSCTHPDYREQVVATLESAQFYAFRDPPSKWTVRPLFLGASLVPAPPAAEGSR